MSSLRPSVLAVRERLADGYAELRRRHEAGGSGVEICNAIADLRDRAIGDLAAAAWTDLGEGGHGRPGREFALVAHAG